MCGGEGKGVPGSREAFGGYGMRTYRRETAARRVRAFSWRRCVGAMEVFKGENGRETETISSRPSRSNGGSRRGEKWLENDLGTSWFGVK